MLEYASASYCDEKDLLDWSCNVCVGNTTGFVLTGYWTDPVTKTESFSGYHAESKAIILAHEGSHNTENWITNLKFKKADLVDYPNATGAKVHRGFQEAWEGVGQEVSDHVADLVERFPEYRVYATGHSLGGALAVLSSLYVTVKKPHVPVHF